METHYYKNKLWDVLVCSGVMCPTFSTSHITLLSKAGVTLQNPPRLDHAYHATVGNTSQITQPYIYPF